MLPFSGRKKWKWWFIDQILFFFNKDLLHPTTTTTIVQFTTTIVSSIIQMIYSTRIVSKHRSFFRHNDMTIWNKLNRNRINGNDIKVQKFFFCKQKKICSYQLICLDIKWKSEMSNLIKFCCYYSFFLVGFFSLSTVINLEIIFFFVFVICV